MSNKLISDRLYGQKVKSYVSAVGDGMVVKTDEWDEVVYDSEYFGDHTENYLVHYKNGKIVKLVNVTSLESIEFEEGGLKCR